MNLLNFIKRLFPAYRLKQNIDNLRQQQIVLQEKNPKTRNDLIRDIVRIKKENLIRQEDKKTLFGLSGRKRKGLARGLKHLRRHMDEMTFDAYIKQRENILSYY